LEADRDCELEADRDDKEFDFFPPNIPPKEGAALSLELLVLLDWELDLLCDREEAPELPYVDGKAFCEVLAETGVTPIEAFCIMEPSDCIMEPLGDGLLLAINDRGLVVCFFLWRCAAPKYNLLLVEEGDVDDEEWLLLFPLLWLLLLPKLMPNPFFAFRCPVWR